MPYILLWLLCAVIFGEWTADEFGYVLSAISSKAVTLNIFEGILISCLLNQVAIPVDFVVWILRCSGAI